MQLLTFSLLKNLDMQIHMQKPNTRKKPQQTNMEISLISVGAVI